MRKKSILLYFKKNDHNNSRLGIAVSKKFGKAIRRNAFKRHVREVFRKSNFKNSNFDVLVVSNNRYFQKDLTLTHEQIKTLRDDVSDAFIKITKSE
jgi:ribonuclease P protein component